MKHSRCAHTLLVALLSALPVLSQAQADGSTVPLDSDGDGISDVDFATDASEYSDDGGLGRGTGDIAVTGVLDFTICDGRTSETGSQIRISRAGSVTTRYVQCE